MKKFSVKHLITTLITGAILALFWIFEVPPLYEISLRFDDINYKFHDKKVDPSIVFVAIDEKSVNHFGRWPWDRKKITLGLDKMTDAKAVLFDMVFSEPTNSASDEALAESIGSVNSICGFFLRHKATERLSESQRELLNDSAIESSFEGADYSFVNGKYIEANIEPIFGSCGMLAAFSTMRDDDSLFRYYPIAFVYEQTVYPSLGVQLLRNIQDKELLYKDADHVMINNRAIALNKEGFTRLNYYKASQYKEVSFYDVVSGAYPKEHFKDKIVILGITEAGVMDVRATPIGELAGPKLHYTFISNYLQNDLLEEPKTIIYIIAFLMLLIPLFIIGRIAKINNRVIVYISVMLLFIIISKLVYIYGNIWISTFYPLTFLILTAIANEAVAFTTQEKESKFIQSAFSNYLSPMLLNKLKSNPSLLSLGGEVKEMTIFFSDIRSFTTISEGMPPDKLVILLNRYFTPMAHIVRKNDGMLDKYIGDAIMAFFNAPVDVEDHAKKACLTALEMMAHLKVLNVEFEKEGLMPIDIGIGLNTAKVTVGNMGSDDRFNYTVIGDGVNLASRVEGLNKNYRTHILITEFTYAQLDESFLCRRLEPVKVKGKDTAVTLYELMENTPHNRELKTAFEKVLEYYEVFDFEKASIEFLSLSQNYKDRVSELFYEKSIENMEKLKKGEDLGFTAFTTK